MQVRDTKLYHHLGLLSEGECRRFQLYLASPYLNAVGRLGDLFEVLHRVVMGVKGRDVSEVELWGLLYAEKAYDQNRLRKDCTALLQELEAFWALEVYRGNGALQARHFLGRLNRGYENRYFPFHHADAEGLLEAQGLGDAEGYDLAVQMGMERYRFDLRQAGRQSAVDLGQLVDYVDLGYCCRKMELLYLELNYRLVTGKGRAPEVGAFLGFLEGHWDRLPEKARMYYHLYKCTAGMDGEVEYQLFRGVLRGLELPVEEMEAMYTAALNHLARRLNAGDHVMLTEMLDTYKELLDKGLLETGDRMLSTQFKNMVVVSARLGAFEWAKMVLHTYGPRLAGEFKQNGVNFAEGVIAYFEGNLGRSAKAFHRVLDGFEDVFYGLDARVYLLRIYYETGDVLGLEALADSFRMYLKRNKELSGSRKANYNAFIRYIRRLARTPGYAQDALIRLRQEVMEGRKIGVTDWLLGKLDGLIQKEKSV